MEDGGGAGGEGGVASPLGDVVPQEGEGVGVGFAGVDDGGTAEVEGQGELPFEERALAGCGLGGVMVVEADFADGAAGGGGGLVAEEGEVE